MNLWVTWFYAVMELRASCAREATFLWVVILMNNVVSSKTGIAALRANVESLISEIEAGQMECSSADDFEKFEMEVQRRMLEIADRLCGLKLQAVLDQEELNKGEKELLKGLPKKYKNMGSRTVKIRMLGGTEIEVKLPYYHQKSDLKQLKKKGVKGLYPKLLLLGIHDGCTSGLISRMSLFATAACSLDESKRLMETLYGFRLDVKLIRRVLRRFALRARMCFESGAVQLDEEFRGRRVVVSTDGGRVRIRKKKRGKKTNKGRCRYKTDWREPKLILIYVLGENGEKDRHTPSVMDASMNGPDATFAMLLYYLKKLGVSAADTLLFVSDGAKWIWDRVNKLIADLGINMSQCVLVLDFYHAVEHLTSIASQKWTGAHVKSWVKAQKKRLLGGKYQIFMEKIEEICTGSENALLLREREYFKNHLAHMHYKEIKDAKLPIGSGGVESGIRRVINLRLKGPGIFWTEEMADAMLLLRSYYKAGRWNLLKSMAFIGGVNADNACL